MCLGTSGRLARSLATTYIFARVRIIGTLVPFCVIGDSKEFPITQKSPGMTFTHIIPGRDIPAVPPAFKKKRLFFFLLFRCLTRSHVMTYLRRLAGCPVSLSVIRLRSVPYCPAPS